MVIFSCYLNEDVFDNIITNALKHIFKAESEFHPNYEKNVLGAKKDFYLEYNFFVPEENCLETKIYNDLAFAVKFIEYIDNDIIINDESDDPYQWILVQKDKKLYVIQEEIDHETESISIDTNSYVSLNLDDALSLLPDKTYIQTRSTDRPAFYVKDPRDWINFKK